MPPFTVEVDHTPDPADVKVINQGLSGHAIAQAGVAPPAELACYVNDESGRIVGGLYARVWDGVLDISLLWVHEDYRGEGYGRQLMAAAEAAGVERGCERAELRTFDYQAPDFYKRLGYEEYLVVDWPKGHRRHFFRKPLV